MRVGKVTRYDERRFVRASDLLPREDLPLLLIQKGALREMYYHASGEMHHEVGGYLLGFPAMDADSGVRITYVERAIRALYVSTPTHVRMVPESFRDVEAVRLREGTILVGYYHSHPKLGIFFSGTDTKNFSDYHPEQYQVAAVVDPSRVRSQGFESDLEWIGFFGWNNEGTQVRVARGNVILVEKRPEIDEALARRLGRDLGQEIAQASSRLHNLLKIGPTGLNFPMPMVIVPVRVNKKLWQEMHSSQSGGLLFGYTDHLAGCSLINLVDSLALGLERIEEYRKYIRGFAAQSSNTLSRHSEASLPSGHPGKGLQMIGVYCNAKTTAALTKSRKRWFFDSPTPELGALEEYCGDYFLIASPSVNALATQELRFRVWSHRERAILDTHQYQVIVSEEHQAHVE
ncbi:MAG: Mov34/MPN/PAD-1 family protein [Candidatus Eisenbacteria bacterium]|nr:Mov34/MPN/PAD-1 family protein [Candidatus Eisenbacteria bacterium]